MNLNPPIFPSTLSFADSRKKREKKLFIVFVFFSLCVCVCGFLTIQMKLSTMELCLCCAAPSTTMADFFTSPSVLVLDSYNNRLINCPSTSMAAVAAVQ